MTAVAGIAMRPPQVTDPSLLRQAAPMIVSRAGLAAMAVTDAIMVAHFSSSELAASNLAEGTFGRLVDVFMAFIHATLVLIVAAAAAGRHTERLAILQRSLRMAIVMGLIGLGVALVASPFLQFTGQQKPISDLAGAVILVLACGLPGGLIALACAVHLEAIGRAGLVARWMILANLINIAGNWLLISGNFGMPALGVLGSAVTTTLIRLALAADLLMAVRAIEGPAVFASPGTARQTTQRDHLRIGFNASGASAVMHTLGIWLTLFAGWLGALPLAAFGAGWILNLPGLLLAAGIGDAIALRVATRFGRDRQTPLKPLIADLAILVLLLAPLVGILCLASSAVAAIYTPDPALQAIMIGLLPLSGLVLMLDGLSYAAAAALRGLKDFTIPTIIQVVAMAATPVLAWFLAFGLGMGVRGLLVAIAITSTARLSLLALRMILLFRPVSHGRTNLERETA